MSDEAFNAAQVGLALARALEAKQVPYAIGGALAYGVWALPRATKDVDINIFLAPEALDPAFEVLLEAGVVFDRIEARRLAEEEGLFIGWVGACRISAPFSGARPRKRGGLRGFPDVCAPLVSGGRPLL